MYLKKDKEVFFDDDHGDGEEDEWCEDESDFGAQSMIDERDL